jgi:trigger factor
MQVSVESIGALGRRVTVAVPADRLEQAIAERLRRLSQQVRLPGFRPGKVPMKMVEARYGGQVMEEVAGDLIKTTLAEAIGQQGLKPAGGTRIQRKALSRGKEFEYTAEFEVFPEIKRLNLAGVRIERPVAKVTEADVDRTLETIRAQRPNWQPVARQARNGDRLRIDFTGRLDGQEFEGGSAKDYSLELGKGALIESMEQGVVGAKEGEERKVTVTFPTDYRHAPLAGKTVDFEIKVNEVAEPVLPEIDENLAKQLGVADGNVDKLRAEVRANLEREASNRSRAVVRSRVMQALREANRFDLPQSLVEAEMQRMRQFSQAMEGGSRAATPSTDQEQLISERARQRVALGLILAEIVRAQGIKPEPAKVRAQLEVMAQEYESPEEFIQWHYAKPERLSEVESLVMEERVVEEVLKSADVHDKNLPLQELMQMDLTGK